MDDSIEIPRQIETFIGFNNLSSLTRKHIYSDLTLRDYSAQGLNSKILRIYLCLSERYHEVVKQKHAYLVFEDENFNIHLFDLHCHMEHQGEDIDFSKPIFHYKKQKYYAKCGTILKDIIKYIKENLMNTTYQLLLNDCHHQCQKIIQQFGVGSPPPKLICNEKITRISFYAPIGIPHGKFENGFIVVSTKSSRCKFEMVKTGDNSYLDMDIVNYDYEKTETFQASNIINAKLIDVIKSSDRVWGSKFYTHKINVTWDFYNFIMNTFTSDPQNEQKVNAAFRQANSDAFSASRQMYDGVQQTSQSANIGHISAQVNTRVGIMIGVAHEVSFSQKDQRFNS